jgi:lipid-binding SYLF domain-containing protein
MVMAAPDKGIPQDLLEKAHCIVSVRNLKTAAFGGKYGRAICPVDQRGAGVDLDDHAARYGKTLENRAIVTGRVRAPKVATRLLELLNRYSARERTSYQDDGGGSP